MGFNIVQTSIEKLDELEIEVEGKKHSRFETAYYKAVASAMGIFTPSLETRARSNVSRAALLTFTAI